MGTDSGVIYAHDDKSLLPGPACSNACLPFFEFITQTMRRQRKIMLTALTPGILPSEFPTCWLSARHCRVWYFIHILNLCFFVKRTLQRAAESSPVALTWNLERGGSRGGGAYSIGTAEGLDFDLGGFKTNNRLN